MAELSQASAPCRVVMMVSWWCIASQVARSGRVMSEVTSDLTCLVTFLAPCNLASHQARKLASTEAPAAAARCGLLNTTAASQLHTRTHKHTTKKRQGTKSWCATRGDQSPGLDLQACSCNVSITHRYRRPHDGQASSTLAAEAGASTALGPCSYTAAGRFQAGNTAAVCTLSYPCHVALEQ